MAHVLITYDLKRTKDYPKLWEELRRLGACKPLLSVWVARLDNTTEPIREHLRGFVDADDKILVIDLQESWASLNLTDPEITCLKQAIG
jgi:hypothetical protein